MTQEPRCSEHQFPAGYEPIGDRSFPFACHAAVSCFTTCCRDLNMFLYPYDIIRLKKRLGIGSEEFLEKYADIVQGQNPAFPSLKMKMADNEGKTCPFLGQGSEGCTVYEDRPAACRMYPLERAVDRNPTRGRPTEFYFLTNHPYCKGHAEARQWTVKEWLRDQNLVSYNLMDDLWAEMDTLFAQRPWEGEGVAGPRQQMAFMVCYNIDRFREYVGQQQLLERYKLEKSGRRDIERDDVELLKFGYLWLQHVLAGRPTLRPRAR